MPYLVRLIADRIIVPKESSIKEDCETVNLNWTQVANRIGELIRKIAI